MTVTELAKITGYAVSTVSKALSDSAEISDAAKSAILNAARETGYYKKAIKRKKRIGTPRIVGVVCDEYADFRRLRNLSRELEKARIKTVITLCNDGQTLLDEFLGVDAVLFFETEKRPCTVPSLAFDGDIDAAAERLSGDLSLIEHSEKVSSGRRKDDIWLF